MADGQQIPLSLQVGQWLEIVNGRARALRYSFDYGPYGAVELELPPGGRVRFMVRNPRLRPVVTISDAQGEVLNTDNVVKIDQPEGDSP